MFWIIFLQNQYSVGCAPLCFKIVIMLVSVKIMYVKFMFSKKATKIDEIFTVKLTVTTYCQIDGEDFVNFCGLLRKRELYYKRGQFFQRGKMYTNSSIT